MLSKRINRWNALQFSKEPILQPGCRKGERPGGKDLQMKIPTQHMLMFNCQIWPFSTWPLNGPQVPERVRHLVFCIVLFLDQRWVENETGDGGCGSCRAGHQFSRKINKQLFISLKAKLLIYDQLMLHHFKEDSPRFREAGSQRTWIKVTTFEPWKTIRQRPTTDRNLISPNGFQGKGRDLTQLDSFNKLKY